MAVCVKSDLSCRCAVKMSRSKRQNSCRYPFFNLARLFSRDEVTLPGLASPFSRCAFSGSWWATCPIRKATRHPSRRRTRWSSRARRRRTGLFAMAPSSFLGKRRTSSIQKKKQKKKTPTLLDICSNPPHGQTHKRSKYQA